MAITLSGDTGITTPMYGGSITANAVTPSVNMKNRIINGAMVIDQRNAGASVTISSAQYTLDRWRAEMDVASKYSVQQNAGSVTPPIGFTNYLGCTSLSAYSVPSSGYYMLQQPIEGYNIADLGWGTANAKTVTLSAWVYSSLTGTFGGSVANSGTSRSYPFTYTISSANTWTQISVTIAGDTTGTWVTNNGVGMFVRFGIGVGSIYSGTAGVWSGSTNFSATGATSVVGTNGATFYITGVQLEVGSTATSFDYRPYTTELSLCYRYCYALYKGDNIYYATAGYYTSTDVRTQIQMPVNMRTTPTISYTGYSQLWRNGTSDANNVNGWSVTLSCPNTVHLTSTNSMSGTAGQIGWLYGAGGGQLIFLAEL
jgi:hypothetical protein